MISTDKLNIIAASRPKLFSLPLLMASVFVFYAIITWKFAQVQSIWVDETTQMSGLTLTYWELLKWLTGHDAGRFGVPGDRMPPLSYILGMGWSGIFGLTEFSLRMFGFVASSLGLLPFLAALRRITTRPTSVVVFALFALSPNFILTSVEIRAYPLFLALASTGTWLLILYATRAPDKARPLVLYALALTAIGAAYTHFFGVVLGGCLFGACFVVDLVRRQFTWHLVIVGCAFLLICGGLTPFIVGASALSSPQEVNSHTISDYIRLPYRLIAGPATAVYPAVLFLYLVGICALLSNAFLVLIARFKLHRQETTETEKLNLAIALVTLLGLGLFGTLLASLAVKNFDVLKPSYSIWMTPALFLFLATGLSPNIARPFSNTLSLLGVTMATVSCLTVYCVLAKNLAIFTHGPSNLLSDLASDPRTDTIVIYNENGPWGFSYFPLVYKYGQRVGQFTYLDVDGQRRFNQIVNGSPIPVEDPLANSQRTIIANVENWGFEDISDYIRGRRSATDRNTLANDLLKSGAWNLTKDDAFPSVNSARFVTFSRNLNSGREGVP